MTFTSPPSLKQFLISNALRHTATRARAKTAEFKVMTVGRSFIARRCLSTSLGIRIPNPGSTRTPIGGFLPKGLHMGRGYAWVMLVIIDSVICHMPGKLPRLPRRPWAWTHDQLHAMSCRAYSIGCLSLRRKVGRNLVANKHFSTTHRTNKPVQGRLIGLPSASRRRAVLPGRP